MVPKKKFIGVNNFFRRVTYTCRQLGVSYTNWIRLRCSGYYITNKSDFHNRFYTCGGASKYKKFSQRWRKNILIFKFQSREKVNFKISCRKWNQAIIRERPLLGIKFSDRIRNKNVRKLPGVKDCRYVIKKIKFDYAGHIVRGEEGRLGKKILEWYPREGVRNQGRPLTRWEDELTQYARTLWGRDTRVRHRWKRMGRPILNSGRTGPFAENR